MYMKFTGSMKHPAENTHWLKRMGIAGFMFFFLKGCLWLLIPWLTHSVLF